MATRKQETTQEGVQKKSRARKPTADPAVADGGADVTAGAAAGAESATSRTPATGTPRRGARGSTRAAPAAVEPDLRVELRRFVAEHPQGWEHGHWNDLMERLTLSGFDTTDRDGLGLALERERLDALLATVQGLGEKRRAALLNRYARLWNLRQASAEEIAAVPGLNRQLAERVLARLG